MQHGSKQEAVLDILENVIAVLDRERRIHGRPVGDLIANLRAAEALVEAINQGPVGSIRRDPFTTLRENPFQKLAEYDRNEPVDVTPGEYNSDDLDRIVTRNRRDAKADEAARITRSARKLARDELDKR